MIVHEAACCACHRKSACRMRDCRANECAEARGGNSRHEACCCEGRAPYENTSESYGQSNRSQALALADVLAQGVYYQLVADVEETNTDILMGAYDLKQAFRNIPGIDRLTIAYRGNGNQVISIGDRQVEVGPMATNEEIERALGNPFLREEARMSVIDRIKAKALKARGVAPEALKRFEADLDSIIAEESVLAQKQAAAVAPHQEAISGIKGEIDGLKSAIDILTNGEPE